MSALETIEVSLPDGTRKTLPAGSSSLDLAQGIGSRLAKAAVAAVVDGVETDLNVALSAGAKVSIITAETDAGRHVLRITRWQNFQRH